MAEIGELQNRVKRVLYSTFLSYKHVGKETEKYLFRVLDFNFFANLHKRQNKKTVQNSLSEILFLALFSTDLSGINFTVSSKRIFTGEPSWGNFDSLFSL